VLLVPLRRCDDDGPARPPIPTQVVSNGEYYPLPKTGPQRQIDERLTELAERYGRKLGLSRRAFLRTTCGVAAALLAMDEVFAAASGRRGRRYFPRVTAAHAADPDAAEALLGSGDDFIFDVQTHHVDIDGEWVQRNPLAVFFFRCLRTPRTCSEDSLQLLSRQNFIKEVFCDSNTTVAVLSGVPTRDERDNALPPVQIAATRDLVNEMAGSQRLLAHGLVRPNLGWRRNRRDMTYQVRQLGIAAWKAYTGATLGRGGWWLDDESAYRMYEHSLHLGIRNMCVHKGLPLGVFDDTYVRPRDVARAATDWPAINFIIYHSAFPYEDELVAQKTLAPAIDNVYCELGSTIAQTIITNPTRTAHVLGKLAKAFGADHLVWGTDSIWWGSPAWQIAAFKQFQIPDEIADQNGYTPLSDADKRHILGLTSARLYNIDPGAVRNQVACDRISSLKAELGTSLTRSNQTYGPADIQAAFRLMHEG